MDLGIKGKRALVTAAGRGIGRSIAECLAREGADICAVARTAADLETVISSLPDNGGNHVGIPMDLEPAGTAETLTNQVREKGFWPIDIVVHNLGGTLDITDPFCGADEWRRVWRLNMEVGVEINNLLLPQMISRKWGRIVHTSSISAMENHGPVPYCSVKAALTAYARSMGRVVAPDGVIMTALLPGAVFTEGGYWDDASKNRPEHVEKYLEDRMAIKRFGRVEEIGNVVAFLCSDHASFCVGSIVPVDGGQGRGFFGQ